MIARKPQDHGAKSCDQKTLEDRLLLERYRRVGEMIPLLYLVVGINALATSLAAQGNFPIAYQLLLPGLMMVACLWRLLLWRKRQAVPCDAATAATRLRTSFVMVLCLSLVGGLWTLSAFLEVHESRRALPAFFMLVASVATATSLAVLPRAAQAAFLFGLAPVSLAMLFSSDLGLQAIALSIGLLAVLVLYQSQRHAREVEHNLKLHFQLEQLAWFDALTGLANRSGFARQYEAERREAGQQGQFTLIMVDLDGFKAANDRFGHVAGDLVLVETARRLERAFPDARLIARFGGDEFVALFVDAVARDDWQARLAAASAALAQPVTGPAGMIPIAASIGHATAQAASAQMDDLLVAADTQLYADKSRRREPSLELA